MTKTTIKHIIVMYAMLVEAKKPRKDVEVWNLDRVAGKIIKVI